MNKLDLMARKVDELRKIASKAGIKNAKKYHKEELVEAILMAEKNVELAETESAKVEEKVDNQVNKELVVSETKTNNVPIDYESKKKYVTGIEIGTLVAFRLPNGKVKSAKVTKKSSKNEKLKLETDYGAEYVVSYDDIIWVRTGKRWPRGVYNLLKGITSENGQKQ